MLGPVSGSMRLEVQAAIEFARNTGKDVVIGALPDILAITGQGWYADRSARARGRFLSACLAQGEVHACGNGCFS